MCNSAVWNELLYCDLMRQTLSKGIMTDYDAMAAFNRVLHALAVITCRRISLPPHASTFLFQLLQNMEFHLVTEYGASIHSFKNNANSTQPGQGVLQGNSSTAPIHNFYTDVSLTTYNKLAMGATFTHPYTGTKITDCTTQYVDDKTERINTQGLNTSPSHSPKTQQRVCIFEAANKNTEIWTKILWILGGNLNPEKCFYYYMEPHYNYSNNRIKYKKKIRQSPGDIQVLNPDTNQLTPIERL
jgi:hypothetical protein